MPSAYFPVNLCLPESPPIDLADNQEHGESSEADKRRDRQF
jgi:hypothetical protein